MPRRIRTERAVIVALVLALSACGTLSNDSDDAPAAPPPSGSATPGTPGTKVPGDLAEANSDTREDSVYPEVGDPLVDALHYDLSLAWTPETDTLEATERLTFRATAAADDVRLDFDDALDIAALTIDGQEARPTTAPTRTSSCTTRSRRTPSTPSS